MSLERDALGRYELLLELGRGGMAVLYLARAQGVGGFSKLFAIKQILPHLAADPVFVDMFVNEGRIAARLSHPHLCPVFELAQERGELFLVMEYLDGVPWERVAAVAPHDVRGLALTAGVLAQACEGLHYAHTFRDVDGTAMPIVHRDVSPQNVFVSADGVVRVLDFGVSKIATDRRRTATGLLKGKLPYMAPEQILGEDVDGRTDVWAVGVMLWEALTGARLFDRDTDFLTYQAIAGDDIPSVNAGGARYPAGVDRVIGRALARDRDARYASARQLGHDLLAIAGEVGGAASREQIADAVSRLCGTQLAARRSAIATAVAARSTVQRASTSPGAPEPAETISMMMRRDAIVVDRRRRRRWLAGALVALAIVVAGVTVIATRKPPGELAAVPPGSATPTVPAPTPSSGPAIADAPEPPAPVAPVSSPPKPTPRTRPRSHAPASAPHAPVATAEPPAPVVPAGTGWYAVDSTPYATIFVDDRNVGDTPLDRISLPAGSHRVRAVLADGRERSLTINIVADRKTSQGTLTW